MVSCQSSAPKTASGRGERVVRCRKAAGRPGGVVAREAPGVRCFSTAFPFALRPVGTAAVNRRTPDAGARILNAWLREPISRPANRPVGTPWYAFARLMTPSNAFLRFATGQTGEDGKLHLPLRLRGSASLRSFTYRQGRVWIGPVCAGLAGAKPAKNRFTPVYAGLNFGTAETGSAKRIHHSATEDGEKEVSPENATQKVENATSYSPIECYTKNHTSTLPPLPHTSPALWWVIGGISLRIWRLLAGICGQRFHLICPIRPMKTPNIQGEVSWSLN